ncbi:MAG: succinate dehydrogenase cytochrome b subunit [Chloroflexota bacterium]|nr:MAG: succinate dehydrogenase cytochrome b subunit [Chloroflexota bacterium]
MIEAQLAGKRSQIGLLALYRSTIGMKVAMAVTGFILYGFVLMHMWGNLKVYAGREYFNHYSEFLREVGAPFFGHEQALWLIRIVLLLAVVLHFYSAAVITLRNRASRPVGYAVKKDLAASFASRTMIWGGIIVAFFVFYHLLDLTTGTVNPAFKAGDPYDNLIASFSAVPVAVFYVVAVAALGVHLFHGVWSMFQTVGWNGPRIDRVWRGLAFVTAAAFVVVGVSIPVAVLAGVIK